MAKPAPLDTEKVTLMAQSFLLLPKIYPVFFVAVSAFSNVNYTYSQWGTGINKLVGVQQSLISILPILHDWSGHRTLFEPDTDAAPRT